MTENPDPFNLHWQFDPMALATPDRESTQPDEVPPPLPPRRCPRRRPVPPPRVSTSLPPTSPSQAPHFDQFKEPGASPSSPVRSPPSPDFSPPSLGYGPTPSAMPAHAAVRPSPADSKPKKRHSFFGSTMKHLAKVVFLESITPGLSTAPEFNNPATPNENPPIPSYGAQSGQVIINGVPLSQTDLLALQAAVGPVSPGSYWYDTISGGYGTIGGPCTGFLPGAPPLGGGRRLAPDASGRTGTGVFINGREIHSIDVAGLQRMGAVVMPGRWWLNASGSYGAEGSCVVLGNLMLQACAASGGAGGGAHSWSTSQGNYGGTDGQGFTYVGGKGWSVCSGP